DQRVRRQLPPRATSKQLLLLLHALEQTQPGGETSMAPIWHELAGRIRRRGLVVILSDCFDRLEELIRALRNLRFKRHEVLLFHILAPEEIEFPFKRWTQFRNLETTDHRLLVDPLQLRTDYLQRFQAFCRQLREQAGQMEVDYHLMRTDEPLDRALGLYL